MPSNLNSCASNCSVAAPLGRDNTALQEILSNLNDLKARIGLGVDRIMRVNSRAFGHAMVDQSSDPVPEHAGYIDNINVSIRDLYDLADQLDQCVNDLDRIV